MTINFHEVYSKIRHYVRILSYLTTPFAR